MLCGSRRKPVHACTVVRAAGDSLGCGAQSPEQVCEDGRRPTSIERQRRAPDAPQVRPRVGLQRRLSRELLPGDEEGRI